ncbi:MAG TPA: nuclease [Thalassospira lucentensis]|uniref:Nuclease n=1 Tax=Thalassospira lucentensis TaxID=168935 RepID=A0A3D5N586_9PROT|nr:thermonuclease family protein [Thalassospira lucentensis]HCW66605.1 nuclease [Thalassospira lucentensis]
MSDALKMHGETGRILPVLVRWFFSSKPVSQKTRTQIPAFNWFTTRTKAIPKKYRCGIVSVFSFLFTLPAFEANAIECLQWPLRESRGEYAYDGDTIYVRMPGLPPAIANMSVRVAGVDTPEIRGQCEVEKRHALLARDRVRSLLAHAIQSNIPVQFCDPQWGRYGGRVVAWVAIGDVWLHDLLINEDLARPYDGGKRAGWCNAP